MTTDKDQEQLSTDEGQEQLEETKAPPSAKARWIRRGIGVVIGASAGFAYYSFVGCTSGGCPIWQDPLVSSGFGGLIGILAIW